MAFGRNLTGQQLEMSPKQKTHTQASEGRREPHMSVFG
jgi:hypothetical protein